MENNENKIIKKIKTSYKITNELNSISEHNITNDLERIYKNLIISKKELNNCKSLEKLDSVINLQDISNFLGVTIQNSLNLSNTYLKRKIEETNQLYRDVEVAYFNKKIELLDNKMNESFKKSEDTFNDITGNTMFSIASVFLGISLTSALVTGIQYIDEDFIILYFLTCLLIIITTIGLSTIFIRKVDKKSILITIIIGFISTIWIVTAVYSYQNHSANLTIGNNITE